MPTVKDAFYVAHPEALAMLRISKRDWKAAAAMTDIEVFEEVTWGFQLQQAIEKALKGWLYGLGETDDPFTDFAVQLRYEVDSETQHLARAVCNAEVAALIRHVEELISRCVRCQAPAVPAGSVARNGVPTGASEIMAAPAGAP